jgi:hypothetical protein
MKNNNTNFILTTNSLHIIIFVTCNELVIKTLLLQATLNHERDGELLCQKPD